jgi:hypothetical protein
MESSLILFIYVFLNNSAAKLYFSGDLNCNTDNIEQFRKDYIVFLLKKILLANFILSTLTNAEYIDYFTDLIENTYSHFLNIIENVKYEDKNKIDNYLTMLMLKYKNYNEKMFDIIKNVFIYYNIFTDKFYDLFKSELLSISLVNSLNFTMNDNKYIMTMNYNNKKIKIEQHNNSAKLLFYDKDFVLNNCDLSNNEKNIIQTNFDSDIKKVEITGNIIGNVYMNNAKLKIYTDDNNIITQFLENSDCYDLILDIFFNINTNITDINKIFENYKHTKQKIKDLDLMEKMQSLINCALCDIYRKKNMEKKSDELGGNKNILYNTNIFWKCIDVNNKEATFFGPLYTDTKDIKITDESEEIICDIENIIPIEGVNYHLDFNKKYFITLK